MIPIRCAQGEAHAFELLGKQGGRHEIGAEVDGLELRQKRAHGNAGEHAGDQADLCVAEGCCDRAQVVRADADIGVREDQQVMPGSARQGRKLVYLVIRTELLRSHQQANGEHREIGDELADDGGGGVLLARDGEQDFVLGIILTAKAREFL